MKEGIGFLIIGKDEHLIELKISVFDGTSFFCSSVYIDHDSIGNLITILKKFKYPEYIDEYSFQLGAFGSKFAGGGLKVNLKFDEFGIIFITINIQSEFEILCNHHVASTATFYSTATRTMLADFLEDLIPLDKGERSDATLETSKYLIPGE